MFHDYFVCQTFFIPLLVTDSHLQFFLHFFIIENVRYSHFNKFCFILCFNIHINHIANTRIHIFSNHIFQVEGIQIDSRYDSLISIWNCNASKLQSIIFFYFLKCNFCVLVRLWQILLYIVFDIFIKFFSVHHTLLPLSDHVMVHSFSADHLLSFFLISHHSL